MDSIAAMLVGPAQRGPESAYAHLASFVRSAPPAQVDALFRLLATTIEARLSLGPMATGGVRGADPTRWGRPREPGTPAEIWVSTAGLGVSWLHVRIDTRPKYYRHEAYERER